MRDIFFTIKFLERFFVDNETSSNNLGYKVYFSEVGYSFQLVEENNGIDSFEVSELNIGTRYQ